MMCIKYPLVFVITEFWDRSPRSFGNTECLLSFMFFFSFWDWYPIIHAVIECPLSGEYVGFMPSPSGSRTEKPSSLDWTEWFFDNLHFTKRSDTNSMRCIENRIQVCPAFSWNISVCDTMPSSISVSLNHLIGIRDSIWSCVWNLMKDSDFITLGDYTRFAE